MTEKEIIEGILSEPIETRTLEFKRLGASKNDVVSKTLESIVAMANTDGGTIILGVDDPEKTKLKGYDRIFGIEENSGLFDSLGQEMKFIKPPLSSVWPPVLIEVKEKNVRIAVVSVPKVTDHFREINGHTFVRQEKGNRRLTPHEIVDFAYVKGFKHADAELVEVDFTLLDTGLYQMWRKARGITTVAVEDVLMKVGLARKDEHGKILPTRAAVILFAEYPTDLMDTKCAIRIFQYSGDKKFIKGDTFNYVGAPKSFNGPAIKQIDDAQQYVLTLLRKGIRVDSGFVTTYRVPERAVKEAITNAVIHRDYYTKRDIEVSIFEDRVEVESPGLLPFNITPSNIGIERASGYRNDLLVKHLREFPDAPNADQNEGVRAMRESMKDENLYPPIFWTYPNLQDAVRVVLLNERAPSEWDKISHHLSQHSYIANREAREILNTDSEVKVSKLFARWVKSGLLVKVLPASGAKQNTRYRLPAGKESNLFTQPKGKQN
ncbi:MAG: putative DNA binding domain-containing protein [bacterium]|nr:putative DNA binding domain-containing protein [bacterium]